MFAHFGPAARAGAHTYARGGLVMCLYPSDYGCMINRGPIPEPPADARHDPRPAGATASPAEAAAIVAALERFMRETAPAPAPPQRTRDPWSLAAMLEDVGREDETLTVWGDPHPWV